MIGTTDQRDRDRKLAATAWFSAAVTGPLGPLVLWLIALIDRGLPETRRSGRAAFLLYLGIQVAWALYIAPILFDDARARAEFSSAFLTALSVWLISAAIAVTMGIRSLRRDTASKP